MPPSSTQHSLQTYAPWPYSAQTDLLEYVRNPKHVSPGWPEGYWPKSPAPPSAAAWDDSVASFKREREKFKELTRHTKDLLAKVPTGKDNHTYLRAILLVIDHNSYHLGQLVAVRRALGVWK